MPDSDFYNDYYEQSQLWGNEISSQEEERIQQTLRLIPNDCSSILEVGCGDGRIINCISSGNKRVCGTDSSLEPLKYVKFEKFNATINSLPFSDKSFDIILCCEVLEHLPFGVYLKALEELQRVASKYIIVSVPNRQSLKKGMATCPQCGCIFRPDRHVRFFNEKILANLFSDFTFRTLIRCQPPTRAYPYFVIEIGKLIKLTNTFPPAALCPQCGYNSAYQNLPFAKINIRTNIKHFLRRFARKLMYTKKYPGWLIALYHREP